MRGDLGAIREGLDTCVNAMVERLCAAHRGNWRETLYQTARQFWT